MSTYFANSITRNCTFINNRADLGGGGMYTEGESARGAVLPVHQ
jgi:predicted outer membrane repeat protein